ncbi:MAG: dipeptide epimerase [Hyphomicrobiaceae bacterium]
MIDLELSVATERFPLANPFVISRGAKTVASVVVAEIVSLGLAGRGECVPYPRYGETTESVVADIEAQFAILQSHCSGLPAEHVSLGDLRAQLRTSCPAGAARNALDCALWDLDLKSARRDGRSSPLSMPRSDKPIETCVTLSLAGPADMAAEAVRRRTFRTLKIKLAGDLPLDLERLSAIREQRPDARMIVDANEGFSATDVGTLIERASKLGVGLIEQPLPMGADHALAEIARAVAVCADESVHTTADIPGLVDRYDAINIKLDKAGGLTEAMAMVAAARGAGLGVMVGSMVATSLSMAPAMIIAAAADWTDLDSPMLLAKDRDFALTWSDDALSSPDIRLWG